MKKNTQLLKTKNQWLEIKVFLLMLFDYLLSFFKRNRRSPNTNSLAMLRFTFLCFLIIGSFTQSMAQTMMPLPSFGSVYTGNVRGYWFTAPTSFIITGLRVPVDAGTGTQNIHVFKINDPTPVLFSATSSNFTTLAYIQGATNNVVQNVNIVVNAGDIIGVLGQAGTANSYSVTGGPFASTILGQPVTLNRLIYQGTITGGPAPNYSWESGTGAISRVELYYTALTSCSGLPTAGVASATTRNCASEPFTLSLSGTTMAGGITYQWESSPAGANNFSPISGATNSSHTVTNQTADTDYRAIITCTNSNSSDTSNVVTVLQLLGVGNFSEDFDTTPVGSASKSGSNYPSCWSYIDTVTTGYGYVVASTPQSTPNVYRLYRTNATAGVNQELVLVSPQTIDLGNGTKQLRFSVRSYSTTTYINKLEILSM